MNLSNFQVRKYEESNLISTFFCVIRISLLEIYILSLFTESRVAAGGERPQGVGRAVCAFPREGARPPESGAGGRRLARHAAVHGATQGTFPSEGKRKEIIILNVNSYMRFPIAGRSDHARADPGAVLLLQRPGDPLGALPAERDARPAHQVDAHVHPRTGVTVGVALS